MEHKEQCTERIAFVLPQTLKASLVALSKETGWTVSEIIREAVQSFLLDELPLPERLRIEAKGKRGLAAVVGKWPGDETDEEIAQALKELS